MKTKSAVTILASLAQDSRLAIFRILVQAGPTGIPAGKIAKDGNIPPSSLSFHMKELLYANLVNARHEGRFIFYSANFWLCEFYEFYLKISAARPTLLLHQQLVFAFFFLPQRQSN